MTPAPLPRMDVAMEVLTSSLSGWPASALLTAAMVYALQRLLRSHGGELAGLVAAAPLTSAPALLWLAHARGAAEGGQAAMAGMHLTAVIAIALLVALNLVPRAWLTAADPTSSAEPRTSARSDACGALCAGLVTGGCLAASAALPVAACGVLACLPWTSLGAFACCARLHGRVRAMRFLVGYAQGLAPRLVFFGSMALLLPQLGAAPAVLLGLAAAGATLTLQRWVVRPMAQQLPTPPIRRSRDAGQRG